MKKVNIIILLLYVAGLLFAQVDTRGSLKGIIKDSQSGDPLVGVNIVVLGTYLGASSDEDGFYLISDMKSGEYTLEVSYIGYKVIRRTGVRVEVGESFTLNFELESTALALGQEIVVIGEKPLIQFDETSTTRRMTSQDISNQTFEDVKSVVSTQVGVVNQDDQLHIRGGRSYEAQYLLDGVSVQDPLSGTGFGLNISANAIEEVNVITGGFDAEYGQATSGIVSVWTKSGTDRFEGFASYKSDHFGVFQDQSWSFNADIIEFNLSGPEPITSFALSGLNLRIPGRIYFFGNFYAHLADDYTRRTANQLYSSISPPLKLF